MLIRDDGSSWTAITQPAHAHLSGQVAAHWDGPLDPEVVLGVEQHDIAWLRWDRRPPLHAPARRAASFGEVPLAPRLELWRDVAARLEAQSPYAALLVSLHATNIHTRYFRPEQRPQELLDAARADQDRLLALLPGASREQAERDGDLLFALDALSLVLCNGWDARDLPAVAGAAVHVAPVRDEEATLDPWPLAVGELWVSVPARTLTGRFDDEGALHEALAATPFHRRRWRLRPA